MSSDQEKADPRPSQIAYDPTGARIVSLSDIGRVRTLNQDDCGDFQDPETGVHLLVVADGMGGHRGGEVASQMAVQEMGNVFDQSPHPPPQELLAQAFKEANEKIFERADHESELSGMGTTAVALILDGQPNAYLAHVGDSRAYRMRGGRLEQLTDDHSVVGELVRGGQLSAEEARHHPQSNEILRALGTRPDVNIEFTRVDVRAGDRFLLCSDGLSGMLSDQVIASALAEGPAEEITQRLIELANEAGGTDNITVQIAFLPEPEAELETTVTALGLTDLSAAATGPWIRWTIAFLLVVGVLTLLILGAENPSPSH